MDSTAKQLNAQLGRRHSNLSHTIFLKRSRNHYGHGCSQRHPSGHNYTTTFHTKSPTFLDQKICFKVAGRCNSEFGHHRGKHFTERRGKGVCRHERIRSSSSVINGAISSEAALMVCGICQKSVRWFVVVAVLVCGHVYHAECLEHRTQLDDIRDPPCPLCSVSLSKAEAA